MSTSFADLLEALMEYRAKEYEAPTAREAARQEAIEYVLQAMLEKLRDLHDRK